MDSITQALLGASVAEAVVGKKIGRAASVIGAVGGTLPDLDIAFYPFLTALEKVSFHRGYSHSFLFCLVAAMVIPYLLRYFKWPRILDYRNWLICMLLVFTTHVLLDAFTSYGTQLFLPFSDSRVSFDSIGIIDPVYSIPLLIGLLVSIIQSFRTGKNYLQPVYIGLMVSTIYLFSTLAIKSVVEENITQQMMAQGINKQKHSTIPVYAAGLKWYGVAIDKDSLYVGNYNLFGDEGMSFHAFPVNDHLFKDLDPHLAERMRWFAKGFYTLAEKDGKIRIYNLQVDMQGIKEYDDYKAPTGFYYEVDPLKNGDYTLSVGVHR